MDIKEKLRLAALCAETEAIGLIPPDSEIDWTPSEEFTEKMNELIGGTPKKRLFTTRRFIIAAAVIAVVSMVCVPIWMRNSGSLYPDTGESLGYIDTESGNASDNERLPNESDFYGNISTPEGLLPPISDLTIPYSPSYLPEGYAMTEFSVNEKATVLEYSNGSDVIRLYYYTGETDFSALDGTKNDFGKDNYYTRVPKAITSDSDGLEEHIFFPKEVEWNKNNIAWNNSGMTFAIMGNESISEDEIKKIASSVNLEPKE